MKKSHLKLFGLIIFTCTFTVAIMMLPSFPSKITGPTDGREILDANAQSNQPILPYHIEIDGNAELEAYCLIGTGVSSDPFIIEDLTNNSNGGLLSIQNTNSYVKIRNCSKVGSHLQFAAFHLNNCSNVILENNTSSGYDMYGLGVYSSDHIQIQNNNFSFNELAGIKLEDSEYILLENNTLDGPGLLVNRIENSNIDRSNTVNGKSVMYYEDAIKITLSGDTSVGQVILNNCTKMVIESLELCNVNIGIDLTLSNDNDIRENNCSFNRYNGIRIENSNDNVIKLNQFNNNTGDGIWVGNSSKNLFRRNTCNGNHYGISLSHSDNNHIRSNTLCQNYEGFSLWFSETNRVLYNKMSNNHIGLKISYSEDNRIQFNSITENSLYGVGIGYDQYNIITYNIMKNNAENINEPNSPGTRYHSNSLTAIILEWGLGFLVASAIVGWILRKILSKR